MKIENFFPDPVQMYRGLKKEIPLLKRLNQDIMNRLYSMKKSSDFWWAITGEYAIQAQYITLLSAKDPRLFVDINNSSEDLIELKRISSAIVNILGRQVILGDDKNYKISLDNEISNETMLIDDEKLHYQGHKYINGKLVYPFKKMTRILYLLRLFRLRIFSIINDMAKLNPYVKKKNTDSLHFSKLKQEYTIKNSFMGILPKELLNDFPVWFVYLSEKIVRKNHEWVTYFGYELNIYQRILISVNYEKFGEKNIKIVWHGSNIGILNFWNLHKFSLFPKLKFQSLKNIFILPHHEKLKISNGILFCPMQLPFVTNMSLQHFRKLINVYKKAVDLLVDGVRNGKNIKIRYKDHKWLRDYVGQFTITETEIPVESKKFEESYSQYSTIVSIPFGTIAAKCKANGIPFIAYHQAINPSDKNSFLEISRLDGVYTKSNLFLNDLKKKIDQLPAL